MTNQLFLQELSGFFLSQNVMLYYEITYNLQPRDHMIHMLTYQPCRSLRQRGETQWIPASSSCSVCCRAGTATHPRSYGTMTFYTHMPWSTSLWHHCSRLCNQFNVTYTACSDQGWFSYNGKLQLHMLMKAQLQFTITTLKKMYYKLRNYLPQAKNCNNRTETWQMSSHLWQD